MKVTLIEFGKGNKNGRIYLYHEVSHVPELAPCTIDSAHDSHGHAILNPAINGENTCAMAKISMDQNGIYAEVNPYEKKKEMFDELMMNGCSIVPAGTGMLNERGEVEDYRLNYVFITKDPA